MNVEHRRDQLPSKKWPISYFQHKVPTRLVKTGSQTSFDVVQSLNLAFHDDMAISEQNKRIQRLFKIDLSLSSALRLET